MLNPNVNNLPGGITGGTTNNVPAHLEEVKDAINGGSLLRRLSQAQIDALSGVTRPTGLIVENLTTGKTQKWDGAKWVDLLDSRGGYVAGDLTLYVANPRLYLHASTADGFGGVSWGRQGKPRWRLEDSALGLVVSRFDAAGVYVDTPLLVDPAGVVRITRPTVAGDSAEVAATKGYVDTKVPQSGGAMYGDLSIAKPNAAIFLNATGPTDTSSVIFQQQGQTRWSVAAHEDGFLVFHRHSASGSYLDSPFLIGSDGIVKSRQTQSGDPSDTVATKGYADTKLPLSGGEVTGPLTLSRVSGNVWLVRKTTGPDAYDSWEVGGSERFYVGVGAESYMLVARDAGGTPRTAFAVDRATGRTTMRQTQSGDPSDTVATKGYVDTAVNARIAAGRFTGATDGSGNVVLSGVPSPPSGMSWSVVIQPVNVAAATVDSRVVSVSGSTVTVGFSYAAGVTVDFFWQAVAY